MTLNPYRSGGPLDNDDLFVGRKDEIKRLKEGLNKNQSFNIFGERRIGKTSLLFYMREFYKKDPLAEFLYFTFESITDEKDFLERLARALKMNEWETYADFEPVLEEKNIVLALDEFDKVTNHSGFSQDFLGILRSWDTQRMVKLLVASLNPLMVYSDQGMLTSPFGNTFSTLHITELDNEASLELLKPLEKHTFHWQENWAGDVLVKLSNHPYWLQFFGNIAFILLEKDKTATLAKVWDEYTLASKFSRGTSHSDTKQATKKTGEKIVDEGKSQKKKNFSWPFPVVAGLFALGAILGAAGGTMQATWLVFIGIVFIIFAFIGSLGNS